MARAATPPPAARQRGRLLARAVLVASFAGAVSFAIWHSAFRTPPAPPTAGPWTAVVTTVAGLGTPGFRQGAPTASAFSDPFDVAVAADGTMLVADGGDNNCIRRVTADRVVTIAGGAMEGLVDGMGAAAAFHTPSGLAVGADGSIYVADTGNHAVRRIAPDGVVTTVAGSGSPGYRDGGPAEAAFDGPIGIAAGRDGTLYVADTYNDRIRRIDPHGQVSTVAGAGGPGLLDGAASSARFDTPAGIALESETSLIVADTNNHVLRRIDLNDRSVTTLLLYPAGTDDVSLFQPAGVAVGIGGAVFVSDRRGRILHVSPGGAARVLAGSSPGFADGLGRTARFFNPAGIAADAAGALVVADAGNYSLRRLAPAGLYPPDPPRSPLAPQPGFSRWDLGSPVLPWPVDPQFEPHEVAGTIGEPRGRIDGDGRDRFHTGIDIRAERGSVVRAVSSGKVDRVIAAQGHGTLNESLSIGPLTYVHLQAGRDRADRSLDPDLFHVIPDDSGRPLRVRIRRGARVRMGDPLGTVNRFNHVHLNAGPSGRELNPLLLGLPGFRDSIPPSIAPRGVQLMDETGQLLSARERGRLVVAGRVRIVVEAWDRVDGNKPTRRLGLFRAGYQVLDAAGRPAPGFDEPRVTMVFDRLPPDPDAARLVYAMGSGIRGQGARRTRYLYTITNRLTDGVALEDFWDSRELPPGDYTLRVLIGDAAGNEAMTGRDLRITIVAQPSGNP